jgi:hypothetical protein
MFRWLLPTVVAVIFGVIVLLGFLVPIPTFQSLRMLIIQWAAVLGAFALLLAYGNLLRVHTDRLFGRGSKQRIASLLLIVAAIGSLVLVLVEGAESTLSQTLIHAVLVPGQSALLAVTGVTLILGGMRLLKAQRNIYTAVFLIAAAFALLVTIPMISSPILSGIRRLVNAAATGSIRGLLLGVTLGIILTGLRIILGIDRPHSGG